jgi:hypothetical protein
MIRKVHALQPTDCEIPAKRAFKNTSIGILSSHNELGKWDPPVPLPKKEGLGEVDTADFNSPQSPLGKGESHVIPASHSLHRTDVNISLGGRHLKFCEMHAHVRQVILLHWGESGGSKSVRDDFSNDRSIGFGPFPSVYPFGVSSESVPCFCHCFVAFKFADVDQLVDIGSSPETDDFDAMSSEKGEGDGFKSVEDVQYPAFGNFLGTEFINHYDSPSCEAMNGSPPYQGGVRGSHDLTVVW